jgi:hypothetical protein
MILRFLNLKTAIKNQSRETKDDRVVSFLNDIL